MSRAENPHESIWRLFKQGETAEARIEDTDHRRQLQLKVADDILFTVTFGAGAGNHEWDALATIAKAELRDRGWSD